MVTGVFFAFAFGLGLWAGAVPVLLARTGLGAAGLGLALVANTGAYVAAMALAGWAVRWLPVRRLMGLALVAQALCLAAVFGAAGPLGLALAMALLGAASGALDLAMNTEGAAVERALARPVLTRMHAAASAAFGLGALGGAALAVALGPLACLLPAWGVSASAGLALWRLGPVGLPSVAAVRQNTLSGTPSTGASSAMEAVEAARSAAPALPRRPVLRLGVVLGICIAAEITAQMWSARFLQQQAASWASLAGAGAALFAGCQAGLRLYGDRLRQRWGDRRLMVGSLSLGALGFGVVALAAALPSTSAKASFLLGLLGFALVGLGTACVVPCCFALLAALVPARAAEALGSASLVAGLVRLPAPALVGAVAAAGADGLAFAAIAGALLLAAWLSWAGAAPPTPAAARPLQ